MIDYDFYVNSYMGSAIPETAFPGMAVRAAQNLQALRKQYQVISPDSVSEQMALCAMADVLYTSPRRAVTAATVGSVSVKYQGSAARQKRLLEAARIYLDIYRGANQWKVP